MTEITRQRRSELTAKMLEALFQHPDGLSFSNLLDLIEKTASLNAEECAAHSLQPSLRCFEEALWTGTIAPVKAGWLRSDRDQLSLTKAGRRAFAEISDPSELIEKAASHSLRGWLSVHTPRAYRLASRSLDQLLIEYRLVRRVGVGHLLGKNLGNANHWKEVLPVQTPQRFIIDLNLDIERGWAPYLDSIGVEYFEGGHTIYIPPEAVRGSVFEELMRNYPADSGIKLIKNHGGVDEGRYLRNGYGVAAGESVLLRSLVYDHRRLTLVANLLHAKDLGPRLFDLVEVQCGEHTFTAYIVEHVGGQTPSLDQCRAGLRRIAELENQGLLKINLPDGFADEDFEPPTCNGNALLTPNEQFRYIDFQNFLLVNYEKYLEKIALEATEKSHFGDRSLLRGGAYLYQSIPGVRLPSRRRIEDRIGPLSELLNSAGVSVERRLVLDFGCNIGMMMAQYLKLGAAWCHGWDRAALTPHTERMLLSLGCTRFSLTGCDIEASRAVESDLPGFLDPLLKGSVISYLAVRGHLGWLDALARIPWQFLIYEGHEDETQEQFEGFIREFKQQVRFEVRGVRDYRDGDSDPRTLAVLVREETSP
ncbi:MAG TPA: hypothetical protein VNG71_12045 [Pyrinomonadaceae bacterium]|nr:hypothetical protein [Pyrinomonadaceae bacterium]